VSKDDEQSRPAEVVDFDALNAALGALPPAPSSSQPLAGDSQGRSNATYASEKPHVIPAKLAAATEDPNAPSIIVQTDDTVPTGAPQMMTAPLHPGGPQMGMMPPGRPIGPGRHPSPMGPFTPQPFAAQAVPHDATLRMPDRPKQPRTPTIVVRTREPTRQQKLLVFMSMLIVFVAGGIAFLIFRPAGLNLDWLAPGLGPARTAPASAPPPPVAPSVVPSAPPSASAPAAISASALPSASAAPSLTPSASASAKKPPRAPAPPGQKPWPPPAP
jgi:hypothetical protein